jgi:hypothetical protein
MACVRERAEKRIAEGGLSVIGSGNEASFQLGRRAAPQERPFPQNQQFFLVMRLEQ